MASGPDSPQAYSDRKKEWREKIVYELLYAGALGSMLFDLMDPLRSWHWIKIPLAIFVVAFVAGYWHLNVNLQPLLPRTCKRMIWDSFIVVSLTSSYFLFSYLLSDKESFSFLDAPPEDGTSLRKLFVKEYPLDPIKSLICLALLTFASSPILFYNIKLYSTLSYVEIIQFVPCIFSWVGLIITVLIYRSHIPATSEDYRMIIIPTFSAASLGYIAYVVTFTYELPSHLKGCRDRGGDAGA